MLKDLITGPRVLSQGLVQGTGSLVYADNASDLRRTKLQLVSAVDVFMPCFQGSKEECLSLLNLEETNSTYLLSIELNVLSPARNTRQSETRSFAACNEVA